MYISNSISLSKLCWALVGVIIDARRGGEGGEGVRGHDIGPLKKLLNLNTIQFKIVDPSGNFNHPLPPSGLLAEIRVSSHPQDF